MAEFTLPLFDIQSQPTASITRLYEHLELFSEGDMPHNTLFVLGRPTLAERDPTQAANDQLLVIDPPTDLTDRFRIEGDAALLYTGVAAEIALPQVQTQVGGVAHIRIGMHYLDIYSQLQSTVVYFPALGILCGGPFGSEVVVPTVADHSDGSEELETLRLLAQLLKQPKFQLFIPRIGAVQPEKVTVMQQLAADVAYLHKVRNAMQEIIERGESAEVVETVAPTLLPERRQSAASTTIHQQNLERIYENMIIFQRG